MSEITLIVIRETLGVFITFLNFEAQLCDSGGENKILVNLPGRNKIKMYMSDHMMGKMSRSNLLPLLRLPRSDGWMKVWEGQDTWCSVKVQNILLYVKKKKTSFHLSVGSSNVFLKISANDLYGHILRHSPAYLEEGE